MKKTVLAATIVFWCVMIGAVIAGTVAPRMLSSMPAPVIAPTAATIAMPAAATTPDRVAQAPAAQGASAPSAGAAPAKAGYTLKDIAQHVTLKDCWMAISGKVYDFSTYIPQHPSAPELMTRHCGKDATRAFDTKDRGRPHGDYAKGLLAKYELGALRD